MAIRFIQCTTTAQAEELLDAGLLWVNQDTTDARTEPRWSPASPVHRYYSDNIDKRLDSGDPYLYRCTDFAYALED